MQFSRQVERLEHMRYFLAAAGRAVHGEKSISPPTKKLKSRLYQRADCEEMGFRVGQEVPLAFAAAWRRWCSGAVLVLLWCCSGTALALL